MSHSFSPMKRRRLNEYGGEKPLWRLSFQAELVDVLRKRRNRPDASDEDLGLPRSPITPQRNVHTINQSEGSLSHLSMGSTDMEDDNASAFNGHHSTPASSRDTMRGNGSDELDLSISAKLSHSAARHKMAIRPTKRGPTRHRRHIDSTALPSTPEVNEDTIKVPSIEIISPAKIKSQSLPPGVKAHQLENHSAPLKESAQFIDVTPTPPISTTTIYINRNISKSHDFDATKEDSEHKLTTLERKKEEEGFFRRLLHRSSKKRKNSDGHEDDERGLDKKEKLDGRDETDKQKVVQALNDNDMNISGLPQSLNTDVQSGSEKPPIEPLPRSIKPKSGPAARQRMLPQEITVSSPVLIKKPDTIAATCDFLNAEITQENLPPKSPRKLTSAVDSLNESKLLFFPKSTTDVKLSTYCAKKEETKFVKASQCRSEEVLIPSSRKSKEENDTSSHSISPPKSVWPEQTERKLYTPKVFGISSLQQKIGKISNKDDVVEEISPKRGKPVEKSKSFRFYSENTSWNNLQTSGNLPSLPDLSYPKKSASDEDIEPAPFSSMINGSTYDKSSDVKFEINDNNLMMKPRLNESFTKSILLTTSRTPTQSISTGSLNQNITQIEENIDKLVKSSFVTVLNYPNEETRKSNVSVTSINATSSVEKPVTPVEPKEEKPEPVAAPKHERTIAIASSETIAPVATPPQQPPTTPPKPRRSSSIFEKSPSTSSLCTSTPTATGGVPEFMKIQLNRVDSARGKCHVVLSKNMREQEARERRLSNDSVEVNDTKPPLPPDVPSKRSSWTKSQDNDLDQQPESPVRKTFERNKSMSDVTKERADEEHRSCVVIERRKSVSDEKLKFERKIEEMKVVERKKSSGDEQGSRKSSIDEDTVVVLRKKSFVVPTSSHKDDTTPELMKVFARRSLKIKDVDDDDADKVKKSPPSVDSDKENQSSSEEKLDKLPKVEISIQNTPAIEKNGNCVVTLTNTKDKEEKPHKKLSESNILQKNIIMPPKPTIFTPTRFSNVTNFRTTASFLDVRKSLSATAPSAVGQKDEQNNNQNNANTVKNNNNNNNANNNSTFVNQLNNNNNNNVSNHRHTLGTASPLVEKAARIEVGEINVEGSTPQQSEFKGILQRRAEWEKRAKEAFK